MYLLTEIAVSILVPLVLSAVLNGIWPNAPGWRLASIAGMAMPLALVALFLCGALRLSSPNDHEGLTYALAPLIGLFVVLLNGALTFPAAFLTLYALRRRMTR
jgi:hypothetical protein